MRAMAIATDDVEKGQKTGLKSLRQEKEAMIAVICIMMQIINDKVLFFSIIDENLIPTRKISRVKVNEARYMKTFQSLGVQLFFGTTKPYTSLFSEFDFWFYENSFKYSQRPHFIKV